MYLRQLAGKPGTILNVSSSVSTTTNEGLSSYASAKTAINRFTEFVHLGRLFRLNACSSLAPKQQKTDTSDPVQSIPSKASAALPSIRVGFWIQVWGKRRRITSSRICTTRWICRAVRRCIYLRQGRGFWMGGLCFRITIWSGWRG